MDDSMCPGCKTTKYKNPSLKLLVNTCGHPLCERCMDMLFVRGTGKCATCGIPLRKNNFRPQQFESAEVERYVDIKGKLSKDFNKIRSDFETLREYNDYLEEVETIAFNLTYGIDEAETKQRIEEYKLKNADHKRSRVKTEDEEELERLIEEEEHLHMEWIKEKKTAEEFERAQRSKKKLDLLNDFMYSNKSANQILSHHRELEENLKQKANEKSSRFSIGISNGKRDASSSSSSSHPVKTSNGNMSLQELVHVLPNQQIEVEGPVAPTEEELIELGYLNTVRSPDKREMAGGFRHITLCSRPIVDAYNGLFIFVD